jgi:hypothetical protein
MLRMKMSRIAELLRATGLALLVALAGCGPGTGGTGTGPVALAYSGGSSGPSFAPSPGGCELPSCDRVDLLLVEDTSVEVTVGCSRFVHVGPWALDEAGLLVLAGTVETVTTAGTTTVPATARLQFGSRDLANASVMVLLLGADGRALAGPTTLQRNTAPAPTFQACTGR